MLLTDLELDTVGLILLTIIYLLNGKPCFLTFLDHYFAGWLCSELW